MDVKTMLLVPGKGEEKSENNLEGSESTWHFSSLMSSRDFLKDKKLFFIFILF
jgi:hypothetical protein